MVLRTRSRASRTLLIGMLASIAILGAPEHLSADATAGKATFEQRCAICHYSDSTAKKIGVGLKGLFARGKFANGAKVDDAAVSTWIEKGGKDMPGFRGALKPDQIRDLIAYLKTL